MTQEREKLWQEMAGMTLAKCKQHCSQLGSCCSPGYCEMAADIMRKAGHSFESVPFGKTFAWQGKCPVPPHFRPLCTLQQCKISGLGLDRDDPEWTEKYFEIREKLEEFEEFSDEEQRNE
jgi:hypothetical protein